MTVDGTFCTSGKGPITSCVCAHAVVSPECHGSVSLPVCELGMRFLSLYPLDTFVCVRMCVVQSVYRPPDSDCLSSTTISTGSYVTTDPEQNLNTGEREKEPFVKS